MEAPPIVDWKSAHPLLRYAGFDNVQVVQSLTRPDADLGGVAGGSAASAAHPGGRTGPATHHLDRLRHRWRATGRCASPSPSSSPTPWNGSTRPMREAVNCWSRPATRSAWRWRSRRPARKSPCPAARPRSLTLDPNANELVFGDTLQARRLPAAPGDERHGLLRQPARRGREQHQAARRTAIGQIHQSEPPPRRSGRTWNCGAPSPRSGCWCCWSSGGTTTGGRCEDLRFTIYDLRLPTFAALGMSTPNSGPREARQLAEG